MPELPEVEIIRQGIEPWLIDQIIVRTEIHNTYLRWPINEKIVLLRNKKILSVQRRAKYILLELNIGWIIIHFGMSGSLRVLTQAYPPKKHDHIDLIINNGCIIRYTDPRRFGAWLWANNLHDQRLLTSLGPEPLDNEFNTNWVYEKSRNKNKLIKTWLMDKKIVVGIGNIYANESLFISGILPNRIVSLLDKATISLLVDNIKNLLLRSIEYGGTTLQNFFHPNGKPGSFIKNLQVYGRDGKPCLICGAIIKVIKQNQRSTFFCPKCQQ